MLNRTEAEVRTLRAAIEAVYHQEKACMCDTCESELPTTIVVFDMLNWLLGEKATPEFYTTHGSDADIDFHWVQDLIMIHKIGGFAVKDKEGT